jgi:hypothetical protein
MSSLFGHDCGPIKGYNTHALLPPHALSVPNACFLSLFEAIVIDSQDRSNHKIRLGL